MSQWDMILKLILSTFLGALIGYERETHGRPAGLRTHMLVCLGSTLFAICSYYIAGNTNDPGRITAQIVAGVGFLGAGTIMRYGATIKGLTSAASIWAVAAIGISVAIGGKMTIVSVFASLLVFSTLHFVPIFERHLIVKFGERIINLEIRNQPNALASVLHIIECCDAKLIDLSSEMNEENMTQVLRLRIKVPHGFSDSSLQGALSENECIINFSMD